MVELITRHAPLIVGQGGQCRARAGAFPHVATARELVERAGATSVEDAFLRLRDEGAA